MFNNFKWTFYEREFYWLISVLAKFRLNKMIYVPGAWDGAKKMSNRSREKTFKKRCVEIFFKGNLWLFKNLAKVNLTMSWLVCQLILIFLGCDLKLAASPVWSVDDPRRGLPWSVLWFSRSCGFVQVYLGCSKKIWRLSYVQWKCPIEQLPLSFLGLPLCNHHSSPFKIFKNNNLGTISSFLLFRIFRFLNSFLMSQNWS